MTRMIGTLVDFVFLLLTRHKMRASSALVSFVGSEILKQVCFFAHLFVPLASAESTPALKNPNKFGISLAYSYLWRSAESTPVRKSSNEFGISLTYSYLCQHEKDDSYLLRVLCGALFQGSDVPAMCAKGH